MSKQYLYGLTIQGIQSYIFDTNKLKEIVGASEIVEQVCTNWFDKFIEKHSIKGEKYLNAAGNIRFRTDEYGAKKIFKKYHYKLLKKAPGLPFSQAVVEIKDEDGDKKEKIAIDKLDKKLEAQRNQPIYAFDLGVMARSKNRRTGYAATLKKGIDNEYADTINAVKFANSDTKALTEKTEIKGVKYPNEFKEVAKGAQYSWLALVHIDGNGMGKRINKIKDGENVLETLRKFSKNVEKSTVKAFREAVKCIMDKEQIDIVDKIKKNDTVPLPLRPIVLGGDDLTLLIRGDLAIFFVQKYLEEFEIQTKKNLDKEGLTAAAGIAYVKEKFPFHYSANLVEDLTGFAKNESNRERSCLHFYKVQDSFIDDYDEIKDRELTTKNGFEFIAGPYYLNSKDGEMSIEDLLKDIKKLDSDDSPMNGMRQWIDLKFNNPGMADVIMKRLETKYSGFADILDKPKAFIDYHTLFSVGTHKKFEK